MISQFSSEINKINSVFFSQKYSFFTAFSQLFLTIFTKPENQPATQVKMHKKKPSDPRNHQEYRAFSVEKSATNSTVFQNFLQDFHTINTQNIHLAVIITFQRKFFIIF